MNIKQLKEKIKDLPDDMEIACQSNSGVKLVGIRVEKITFAQEQGEEELLILELEK